MAANGSAEVALYVLAMQRGLVGLGVGAVMALSAACGSDSPSAPAGTANAAGTWQIASQLLQAGGLQCTFDSTTLTLAQDGVRVAGNFRTALASCDYPYGPFTYTSFSGSVTGTVHDSIVALEFTGPSFVSPFVGAGMVFRDSIVGVDTVTLGLPNGNSEIMYGPWTATRP